MFTQNAGWEGEGLPPPPPHPLLYQWPLEGVGLIMYIKLPVYLFFYVALGLNDFDFDAGKSITRAIGRVDPHQSRFASIKIITSRAI